MRYQRQYSRFLTKSAVQPVSRQCDSFFDNLNNSQLLHRGGCKLLKSARDNAVHNAFRLTRVSCWKYRVSTHCVIVQAEEFPVLCLVSSGKKSYVQPVL